MLRYEEGLGIATNAIRNAKCSYERRSSLHIKDDPRVFNEYARSMTKTKETIGPLTDDFGNVILEDGVNV